MERSRKCIKDMDRVIERASRVPVRATPSGGVHKKGILVVALIALAAMAIALGGYIMWEHNRFPAQPPAALGAPMAVISNCVLRSGPGVEFEEVEKVDIPTAVQVLDKVPGYCKVRTANGKQGWVAESDVTFSRH